MIQPIKASEVAEPGFREEESGSTFCRAQEKTSRAFGLMLLSRAAAGQGSAVGNSDHGRAVLVLL